MFIVDPKRQRPAASPGVHAMRPATSRRRGVLLVAALICIAIAVMLASALTKSTLLQHRQTQLAAHQQQSSWLADSGVGRAVRQLRNAPEYRGETWEIPADVLGSGDAAAVIIKVESVSEPTAGWRIRVESQYPTDLPRRILCVRELTVPRDAVAETDPN
jgi:hypothetical protein